MSHGRHETKRKPGDLLYDPKWSGVSYAPHCSSGCTCEACGEKLHLEGADTHYCPYCDDFKRPRPDCKNK